MSRNDRHIPLKFHAKNCNAWYSLQRLYARKSVTRKEPKITPGYSREGSTHYHGTGQMYVGILWHCTSCGLILSDPIQCPKCESRDIANGKNDSWDQRSNYDYWHCKACSYKWKVKIHRLKTNKVEIR
jgi:rubrerythrin